MEKVKEDGDPQRLGQGRPGVQKLHTHIQNKPYNQGCALKLCKN